MNIDTGPSVGVAERLAVELTGHLSNLSVETLRGLSQQIVAELERRQCVSLDKLDRLDIDTITREVESERIEGRLKNVVRFAEGVADILSSLEHTEGILKKILKWMNIASSNIYFAKALSDTVTEICKRIQAGASSCGEGRKALGVFLRAIDAVVPGSSGISVCWRILREGR